ncbi:MAG: Hsp20/alpha crystallin family protein [Pseudomonadota bacterium]
MSSSTRKTWMWAEACAVLEEAEQLHRRFFSLLGVPARLPVWEPPADVLARDGEIWVVVALPGVDPESVELSVTPTGLSIRAERTPPLTALEGARVVRLELPYGRFERTIDLPPGRYVLAERRLANGCLELRLIEG